MTVLAKCCMHSVLTWGQTYTLSVTLLASGGFTGGLGEAGVPSKVVLPHPRDYAWTIQNFINVLIFRVRPRVCYVKGTMKRQKSIIVSLSDQLSIIRSSTDSDCTRTHLRGPRIKKFSGGACPQTPLGGARISALLLTLP